MLSFYEWLKENKSKQENVREVKSPIINGYIDLPISISYEKEFVKKNEVEKFMKMEHYVNAYTEVNDNQFDEMLKDRHLSKYKALADECNAIDGGIASDLRNHGWRMVALQLAHERNLNKEFRKLDKLADEKTSTFEKLSKFVMSKLGLKKEVVKTSASNDDTMQR